MKNRMATQDIFGADATQLQEKRLFLLDMDGTIYEEDRLFAGTLEFLDQIVASGGRYVFITNNSSKSVEDYIKKVRGMGISVDYDHFFTSAQATILYLKEHHPKQVVYCMGTQSFVQELRDGGIEVVTEVDGQAEVVLMGFDTELTFEKLKNTCIMLNRDLPYIATNPDFTCPTSFGFVPDCGSVAIMLKNATGKEPIFIGKPEPTMVDFVIQKFGYRPEDAVVIGDRIYTDVAAGLNAGVTSICVLSGETKLEQVKLSKQQPSFTFESIQEILKCIQKK